MPCHLIVIVIEEHADARSAVDAAIGADARPVSPSPLSHAVAVRPAAAADHWAVAELHCEAFYPRLGDSPLAPLLRFDRVVALQVICELLACNDASG